MRVLVLVVICAGSLAHADVGPFLPDCVVPPECVRCDGSRARPSPDCADGPLDAGFVVSDCNDKAGAGVHYYLCPPGKKAARDPAEMAAFERELRKGEPAPTPKRCGCSATEGATLAALLALVLVLRRR